MQQHTGQHVLSAAFDRLFGVRTESFHMGDTLLVDDRSGARSVRSRRSPRPKTTRIVSCGRIGRSRSDLRPPKRPRRCRSEGIGAERAAALDRRAGLRPVGVRRHARRADRRDRHHRDRRLGKVQGRIARRVPLRWPGACSDSASGAARCRRSRRHLSVPPIEMPASIERMQDEAKAVQRTVRGFQEKLAAHEAQAHHRAGPNGRRDAADRGRSARGLGPSGTESDRRCRDGRSTGRCRGALYRRARLRRS